MIDLKNYLFKSDVRAQKDEEKVFVRKTCVTSSLSLTGFVGNNNLPTVSKD